MVEFNPRLEFKEEKGVSGLLFFYIILMVGAELFFFIFSTAASQSYFKSNQALKLGALIMGLAFIMFVIFNIITLYKIPKIAVKVSKIYLIARLAYLVPLVIISLVKSLEEPGSTDVAAQVSASQTTIYSPIIELSYMLCFSALWYLYFVRSKRIKEYYANVKQD